MRVRHAIKMIGARTKPLCGAKVRRFQSERKGVWRSERVTCQRCQRSLA
jgi:hypothetical protein